MEMIILVPPDYELTEDDKRQFLESAVSMLTVPHDGHVLPEAPESFDDEYEEELVFKWGGQRFLH